MAGDARARELIELGDGMFTKRQPLLSLWQEIAEIYYVERADFTRDLILGEDLAGHLMDSYPMLLRRELGNNMSAMLRPRDSQWFRMTTEDEDRDNDQQNRLYFDYVLDKLRRGIYHPSSNFIKTTKAADHDFVTFGQCVFSVEESQDRTHPFFRGHHLRDVVWLENADGDIDHAHRKDNMSARKMRGLFGEKAIHKAVKDACKKEPNKNFEVRSIVMPTEEYDYIGPKGSKGRIGGKKLPFAVIYVDVTNEHILHEGYMREFPYVIPRWHTVSGSVYAYSPASIISLPDARMAQELSRILLEAGEKAVDPPLIAVSEAVREVNIAAGAITWADIEMDGKLQDAVKPLDLKNNVGTAFEMRVDLREMLNKAWFVDKISLPSPERDMTAYETARRLEEFVRNLLPLFEPMEIEYNTRLLDKAFSVMMNMGHFPPSEVPENLSGAEVSWVFESPIQDSSRRMNVERFAETLQLIGAASQAGVQSVPVDLDKALRDAIIGTGAPADWMRQEEDMAEEAAESAQANAIVQGMQEIQGGAQVAQDVAVASQEIDKAMMPAALQGPGGQPALPPPSEAA